MAQPAAKIPMQNRQYTTTSKNPSYTVTSSLQISPDAGKAKPALPASATVILNLAGIAALMLVSGRQTVSSTAQDLQKLGMNIILHYSILTLNEGRETQDCSQMLGHMPRREQGLAITPHGYQQFLRPTDGEGTLQPAFLFPRIICWVRPALQK